MDKVLNNISIALKVHKDNKRNGIEVSYLGKNALSLDGFGTFVQNESEEVFSIEKATMADNVLKLISRTAGMKIECDITPEEGESCFIHFNCCVTNTGNTAKEGRLVFNFNVDDSGIPRWMIPAMFYKDNRPKNCALDYPRYDFEGSNGEKFVSDYWAFRSDRSSLPSVFCWTDNFTTAVLTDETFSHGISGLSFKGNKEGTQIGLNFPFCEEPIAYVTFRGDNYAPDYRTVVFNPEEPVSFLFRVYVSNSDLHSYNVPVREIYEKLADSNPLNPWVSLEQAADLTAYGLYKWHYRDEYRMFYETVGFDNIGAFNTDGKGCRPNMHISWVSGVPYAYALLRYGINVGNEEYKRAGRNVIDKVTEGMSPGGVLWSQWTVKNGWGSGWNPRKNWTQARTVSEAILFMIRAYDIDKNQGVEHEEWKKIINANLEFAVRNQREDGNFGSYYNVLTGEVEEWDGCAGIVWIPALLEAHRAFGNDTYRQSALRGGEYYKKFVLDEYVYGAPEDVHLTPTSEDAYNAVMTYVLLYEADKNEEWLQLAKLSADWMMTFRWAYNVKFPDFTILEKYDYKTRGGDIASPSNNHIHNYGLFCLPEVLRLYKYTGDEYYCKRMTDHLACFLQFVAREHGDFNAGKGMVTERWFHTDWWSPKGSILELSHTWCIGLTLYAAMEAMETIEIPVRKLIYG